MELPIQLKLFKKLELYQELKFQDKKSSKAGKELRRVWKTEKLILGWTARGHHLLAHPISHKYVREGADLLKGKEQNEYDLELSCTFTNLINRGFAQEFNNNPNNIVFTSVGLLMGEVINDVENSKSGGLKYDLVYYLTWMTAVAGALFVIINFFIKVKEIFDAFFALIF